MKTRQSMGRNAIITTAYRIATRRSEKFETSHGGSWGPIVALLALGGLSVAAGFALESQVPPSTQPWIRLAMVIVALVVLVPASFHFLAVISSRAFSMLYLVFEWITRILIVVMVAGGTLLTFAAVGWAYAQVSRDNAALKDVEYSILAAISVASLYFTTLPQKFAPAYLSATTSRCGAHWQLWLRWLSLLSITLIILTTLMIVPLMNQTLQVLAGGSVLAVVIFWVTRMLHARQEINAAIQRMHDQAGVAAAVFAGGNVVPDMSKDRRTALLGLIDALTDPKVKTLSGQAYNERCDAAILTTLHYVCGRLGCGIRTSHLVAHERLLDSHLGCLTETELADAVSQACMIWRDQLMNEKYSIMSPHHAL